MVHLLVRLLSNPLGLALLGMMIAAFGGLLFQRGLQPLPPSPEHAAAERFTGRLIRAEEKISPHNPKSYKFEIQPGAGPARTFYQDFAWQVSSEAKGMQPGDRVEAAVREGSLVELVWNSKYLIDKERPRAAAHARYEAERAAKHESRLQDGVILMLIGFGVLAAGGWWLVRAWKNPRAL